MPTYTEHKALHPLINKIDSPHYDTDSKAAIEQFEEKYTINELYNWAKITRDKYLFRIGLKDEEDKEMRKINSYDKYQQMLKHIIDKYPTLADMTAKTAYNHLEYNWRYR